jgi:hypothetical protein
MEPIEIRKYFMDYPYTNEQYNDPDPALYVDEKGNDVRFGMYGNLISGAELFFDDSLYMISLKKIGKWNKMDEYARKRASQIA